MARRCAGQALPASGATLPWPWAIADCGALRRCWGAGPMKLTTGCARPHDGRSKNCKLKKTRQTGRERCSWGEVGARCDSGYADDAGCAEAFGALLAFEFDRFAFVERFVAG